jgi:hypothetical protein
MTSLASRSHTTQQPSAAINETINPNHSALKPHHQKPINILLRNSFKASNTSSKANIDTIVKTRNSFHVE